MTAAPEPEILAAFEAAKGFMPVNAGLALYTAAAEAGQLGLPLLEVGTYCGRSTILLADVARETGTTALTVDHHRGSEAQQPGWDYHDPETVDPEIGYRGPSSIASCPRHWTAEGPAPESWAGTLGERGEQQVFPISR
jgi:MMP 1-O-methyltransferase